MSPENTPTEITLTPPFVAAAQFAECVAFLRALGYHVVSTHPSPDGCGGEVIVKTTHIFCPCCAAAITLAHLRDGGTCAQCRDEACIGAAGETPSGHGRFASLFMGGPFKGRILRTDIPPLFEKDPLAEWKQKLKLQEDA